jgi:WD40 repeat protein
MCYLFRQAVKASRRKRMKTQKLLEMILTTCFLTVIFAACQQTTQTELIPNAQTNQFTVRLAWSSVATANNQKLNFSQAHWRNNNEVYLGGLDGGMLWSVDSFSQHIYGRTVGEVLGADWSAEWNPQGTQLLSSEYVWDAEATENQTLNLDYTIPSNIIYNFKQSRGIAKWSPSGSKIAFTDSKLSSEMINLSILNVQDQSRVDMFNGVLFQSLDWISENQIIGFTRQNKQSEQYLEIINIDTQTVEKSIKVADFMIQNNLQYLTTNNLLFVSKNHQKLIISGGNLSSDSSILLINLQNLSINKKIDIEHSFFPNEIQWLEDNKTFVILSNDYSIKFIDTETSQITREINTFKSFPIGNRTQGFQISPDLSKLIKINEKYNAELYDANTMESISCQNCKADPHIANNYQIILNSGQKKITSIGRDGKLIIQEAKTGISNANEKINDEPVYAIANSPDGNTYATAGDDSIIHLWDSITRAELGALVGHNYTVRALSWKPNSPTLASAGWDDTVRLWDTTTQTLTATLSDHTNYVNAVQYNQSGTELASASSDGTIKLRNPDTGETLYTLQPADSSAKVFTIAYSSDGTRIASGSDDHRVRIWNAQTQTLEATLTGHLGAVRTVIWLNPTTIVTGGMDGRIIFWDTTSQQMIQELKPNLGAVFTITATADGTQLFAGFDSGNIVSWKVSQ